MGCRVRVRMGLDAAERASLGGTSHDGFGRSGPRPRTRLLTTAALIVPSILGTTLPGQAGIDNYGLTTSLNAIPGVAIEFDTLSNAQLGSSLTVGGEPQNAVFSPDGRYAYLISLDGNNVSVIDVVSHTITA